MNFDSIVLTLCEKGQREVTAKRMTRASAFLENAKMVARNKTLSPEAEAALTALEDKIPVEA